MMVNETEHVRVVAFSGRRSRSRMRKRKRKQPICGGRALRKGFRLRHGLLRPAEHMRVRSRGSSVRL